MKNRCLIFAAVISLLTACQNGDGILGGNDFDDYTEQNVYFPIRYPVRTLILGEDRIDNSIDNMHAFHIGASIGGLRENTSDIQLQYEVKPDLLSDLQGVDSKNGMLRDMMMMPASYYSIENEGESTIKAGGFNSLIRVNLTDDYFNDPEAYKLTYAIPLQLTETSFGNILSGKAKSSVDSPNPVNAGDWESGGQPRDFTIFAVKYVNPWHGNYFQRGVQKIGGEIDTIFHTQDIEKGQLSKMVTSGYKEALYHRMGDFFGDKYYSVLKFSDSTNGEGTITVSTPEGAAYTVSGTGNYYESSTDFAIEHGSWLMSPTTGKDTPHLTLTLDFEVQDLANVGDVYQFTDTLVFRDKGISYEEFTPQLTE